MAIISSPGGVRETTIKDQPDGGITLRQGTQYLMFSWAEAEEVHDYLHKERHKRATGSIKGADDPRHPGYYLDQELITRKMPLGAFAKACGLQLWEVQAIVKEEQSITPVLALVIAKVLSRNCDIPGAIGWLLLQAQYDLAMLNKEPVMVG